MLLRLVDVAGQGIASAAPGGFLRLAVGDTHNGRWLEGHIDDIGGGSSGVGAALAFTPAAPAVAIVFAGAVAAIFGSWLFSEYGVSAGRMVGSGARKAWNWLRGE